MGVNLGDIVKQKPLLFDDLAGKTIAVDALNTLYQFLSSIRQPDGTPLMDSEGNVTSHLSGLFYRTGKLLKMGVKPVYVFDGKPLKLKKNEIERRRALKRKAEEERVKALEEGRIDDARKFAKRTSKLTPEMREESKRLVELMGLPVIQAPSEGEAQCALVTQRGDAWATASMDYDALLFGAPRVVRGMTLSGKFELGFIELAEVLGELGVTREQLIDVALLCGTDFNEGVHGIGQKKGLKAVLENRLGEFHFEAALEDLEEVFLKHPVDEDYEIKWGKPDEEGLIELLHEKHQFSKERIIRTSNEIIKSFGDLSQQNLGKWF